MTVVSDHLVTVLHASGRRLHRRQFLSHDGTKSLFFLAFCVVHVIIVKRVKFSDVSRMWISDGRGVHRNRTTSEGFGSGFSVTQGGVRLGFEGKSQYQYIYRVRWQAISINFCSFKNDSIRISRKMEF